MQKLPAAWQWVPVRLVAWRCGLGQGRGQLSSAVHMWTCINAGAAGTSRHKRGRIVSMLKYSRSILNTVVQWLDDPLRLSFLQPGSI